MRNYSQIKVYYVWVECSFSNRTRRKCERYGQKFLLLHDGIEYVKAMTMCRSKVFHFNSSNAAWRIVAEVIGHVETLCDLSDSHQNDANPYSD